MLVVLTREKGENSLVKMEEIRAENSSRSKEKEGRWEAEASINKNRRLEGEKKGEEDPLPPPS